ncbi:MAG: glycosyltransferase family 39 protein [Anaerolineae bacterium]|nr:glycosyltransferase family 39 protein [Anaerolineae bacterium]MDW8102336.1 glycosyltransferase family 39 protein [Anaerolineae bacterium]
MKARLIILLMICGGFLLRLYRLGAQSLWYDETVSLLLAHKSLPALTAHTARDIHPPLYYYLLHFWIRLAGDSEFCAAFLSLWFGVLLLALIFGLSRRLLGEEVAYIACFLAAISPYQLWYSQEVRMYTLGACLGLLAADFLLRSLTHPRRPGNWVAYSLVAAAGLYTLYYFAFLLVILAPFALWAGFRRWGKRYMLPWLGAQVLALVFYSPWIGIAFRQATNPPVPPWRSFTPWPEVLTLSWSTFSFGHSAEPEKVWPFLLITLAFYLIGLRPQRVQNHYGLSPWERSIILALYSFGPLALIQGLSYITPLYHPRYLFPFSPPFYIVLAHGVLGFRSRKTSFLILVFIAMVSSWSILRMHFDPKFAPDDHRSAAKFLEARLRAGDAVLINAGYVYPALMYYYEGPAGWIGRLVNYKPSGGESPVFLMTGSIGGAESLGWGNPEADFYPTTAEETARALREVFAHHPRVWVYRCYDTVVDPEGFIRRWLEDNGVKFEDALFAGESFIRVQGYLTHYLPPYSSRAGVIFGDFLELEGFSILNTEVESGSSVEVALYWRPLAPLQNDYKVSLRVYTKTGKLLAQSDEQPLGSSYLPSNWPPGRTIYHPMKVIVPAGTPPGLYFLDLLVYSPGTMVPLPVRDESRVVQGVRARLGEVEVLRPAEPVAPPELPRRLRVNFSGMVELRGTGEIPEKLKVGEALQFKVLWRSLSSSLPDLIVFAQLLDKDGNPVVIREAMPADNLYPTSRWEKGEFVLEEIKFYVPGEIPSGRYPLILGLLKADTREYIVAGKRKYVLLGHVEIEGRKPEFHYEKQPSHLVNAQVGDFAVLRGFDWEKDAGHLLLTLYWEALGSASEPYKIFLHLVAPDGRVLAQADSFPQGGTLPTTAWIKGERLLDKLKLALPPDLPPGLYRLIAGMYDPDSGKRVPVIKGDVALDHVVLGLMELP